jgi:hypothetical protein
MRNRPLKSYVQMGLKVDHLPKENLSLKINSLWACRSFTFEKIDDSVQGQFF